jgi:hypothetical protein
MATVEDEYDHVGQIDGLQGLHHRELLGHPLDPPFAPHAGGIHQNVALAVLLERHLDGVTRGAGFIEHHLALLAEHAVHQRGFPHVGAANHRDAHGIRFVGCFLPSRAVGAPLLHQLAYGAQSPLVHRRDIGHGIEAEGGKVGHRNVRLHAIHLVDHQNHRFGKTPQALGDLLVSGHQAVPGIGHEQHRVGFVECQLGLLLEGRLQRARFPEEPPGVDEHALTGPCRHAPVAPIPGQAGNVGHQSVPAPGQLVEECGLTDVGPANEGDGGNHPGPI